MADGAPSAAGEGFQLPDSRMHQLYWERDDIHSFVFLTLPADFFSRRIFLFLFWFICHYCSPFTCTPVNIKSSCIYSKNIRLWMYLFWQPVCLRPHCSSTQACRGKRSGKKPNIRRFLHFLDEVFWFSWAGLCSSGEYFLHDGPCWQQVVWQ